MGDLLLGLFELVVTCVFEGAAAWPPPSPEKPIPKEPICCRSCRKPVEK